MKATNKRQIIVDKNPQNVQKDQKKKEKRKRSEKAIDQLPC
jgi:hypothetical protein